MPILVQFLAKTVRTTTLVWTMTMVVCAYAQSYVNMLERPDDAVGIGLGETGTAANSGFRSYVFNPAHILGSQAWTAFYQYQSFDGSRTPVLSYFSTGFAAADDPKNALGIYLRRFNYGISDFSSADKQFDIYDMSIGLVYGRRLGKRTDLGVSANYVRSVAFEGTTINTAVIDFGYKVSGLLTGATIQNETEVHPTLKKLRLEDQKPGLNVGLALLNMGPQVQYSERDEKLPLPFRFRAGIAYQLITINKFGARILADFEKELIKVSEPGGEFDPFYVAFFSAWSDEPFKNAIYHFGTEIQAISILKLRGGYRYSPGRTSFSKGIYTIGAGIQMRQFSLDFGQWLGDFSDDPNANTFIVSFRFASSRDGGRRY